jgi:hypothetical protein
MSKEQLEIISIVCEYVAFFLAAADFLGEDRLTKLKIILEGILRLAGKVSGTFAVEWVKIGGMVFI